MTGLFVLPGPDAVTLGAATLPIEAFLGGNVFTAREVAQRSPPAERGVAT